MKGIKQIKKYRLIREIGKGATGVVYEAVDDQTNKLQAVKAIPSVKLQDKRVMENFKRELKLLHGLNHGNIIKIAGVEKTVNNIYLILEYCNGGNLYEYSYYYRKTFGKNLAERSVQKILRQMIEGLEYMHNCRTVHRDIKLENILINFNSASNTVSPGAVPEKVEYDKVDIEDISVKIADLGYARELEGGGVASTICGTPITMAPDIIHLFDNSNKDHKYNSKVDLWSLGAITYELLTGRPPFYASNYKQLFEEIMQGKYNLPKNLTISVEAITFINGLLQFYPEKRMSWQEIRNHPFITNESETFHPLDLHTIDTDFQNPQELQMNTKDCENFLWILFKPKAETGIKLDKIDASIIQDPIISTLIKDNQKINNIGEDYIAKGSEDKNAMNAVNPENPENPQEDSEENFEDANNELNLCDEEEVIEKKAEVILIEKEPDVKANVQSSGTGSNNSINNRIFDKIFTEMKQELKSSKSSSIEKKSYDGMKDSGNDSKEEPAIVNIVINTEVENNVVKDIKHEINHEHEIKPEVIADVNIDKEPEVKPAENEAKVEEKAVISEISENPENKVVIEKAVVEGDNLKPTQSAFPIEEDLPKNPSYNIFQSSDRAKESRFYFENISEERDISLNRAENKVTPIVNNPYLSEDFFQVNRDNSDATNNREFDEELNWEIISTTSIIENEIQYEIDSDGYQIINEYFV